MTNLTPPEEREYLERVKERLTGWFGVALVIAVLALVWWVTR